MIIRILMNNQVLVQNQSLPTELGFVLDISSFPVLLYIDVLFQERLIISTNSDIPNIGLNINLGENN